MELTPSKREWTSDAESSALQCKKLQIFQGIYGIVTNVMKSTWKRYMQLIETLQDSKNLKIKLLTLPKI